MLVSRAGASARPLSCLGRGPAPPEQVRPLGPVFPGEGGGTRLPGRGTPSALGSLLTVCVGQQADGNFWKGCDERGRGRARPSASQGRLLRWPHRSAPHFQHGEGQSHPCTHELGVQSCPGHRPHHTSPILPGHRAPWGPAAGTCCVMGSSARQAADSQSPYGVSDDRTVSERATRKAASALSGLALARVGLLARRPSETCQARPGAGQGGQPPVWRRSAGVGPCGA